MSLNNDGFYNSTANSLPVQMIPLKDKLKKVSGDEKSFGQKCMDSLENIGRQQYRENLRLIENYEMIKGRFIFNHYFENEGYDSNLSKLAAEFELPNYLRHYDIISPVINTLSGEWQKRPDLFKIRQLGEEATNEYTRAKKDLLEKYVLGRINAEINQKLIAEGVDLNKSDFISEEEAAQYKQQIEEFRQQLTPPEIQKYMDTDFATLAEIWADHEREIAREYFNLPEKEKVEFEDMIIADHSYRHYYLTPSGVGWDQETWNPVNTFKISNPDNNRVEEGDLVGRIFYISLNTIIDKYGHKMSKEDFKLLQGESESKKSKFNDSRNDWVYDNYMVPFKDYPTYDLMRDAWNVSPKSGEIAQLSEGFFKNLSDGSYFNERPGYYFVTEGYWMSQKMLIKLTYFDELINEIVVRIVDENVEIPEDFVESKNIFADEHDINTYVKTWIPECWKGIKINTAADQNLKKDLYLSIGPNDFQFKGDNNLYGSKLPVCGQEFSVRNSRSMSLVDMMKPHQIGYNVAMNQLYQIAEKEVGMFMVMDVNMFPNSKDWGGEDAWDKWMLMAKNMGMLPADTSPQNVQNSLAATGGQFPRVLDLNLAGQMVSRMNMAKFYEEQAMKQIGFNAYRLGSFAQSSTATGIQQGQAASYSQTESYFTNFSNYLRRCLKMALDMAQYVQSQKAEIAFTYTKGDLSKGFIKIFGTDLMLPDIGVFVSNSQEHARQLEMIRQFALSNNTAGLTPVDVADVIMMNSPDEIRRQLKVSYEKLLAQQQQAQQSQQEQGQKGLELQAAQIEKADKQFYDGLENDLDIARIKAGADIINTDQPSPQQVDNTSSIVNRQNNIDANSIKREKLALDRQKQANDVAFKQQELSLKQAKINADLEVQRQETLSTKIMKGVAPK